MPIVKVTMKDESNRCLRTLLKGFLIGSSDLIPGISGATMTIILGIYEQTLKALRTLNVNLLKNLFRFQIQSVETTKHLKFLITLSLGMILAVFFFTQVIIISDILVAYPREIYSLFFGLVLGSAVYLLRENFKPNLISVAGLSLGVATGLFVTNIIPSNFSSSALVLTITGFLSATAMLIPGISGSYVLLLMGKYQLILKSIEELNLTVLGPFLAGICVAVLVLPKIILTLIEKDKKQSYNLVSGFLFSSLQAIWPLNHGPLSLSEGQIRQPIPYLLNVEIISSIIIILFGFLTVTYLTYLSKKTPY